MGDDLFGDVAEGKEMFVVQPSWVQKITDALGVDKVRSLTIHLEVNNIPTVRVEFLPTKEQMDGVASSLQGKTFKLLEVEDNA